MVSPATLPPPLDTSRPVPQDVQAEPPPRPEQPPADEEIPVQPHPTPVQQMPSEPRQARVNHEPITAEPPLKTRAVPKSRPEPKEKRRATPKTPPVTAKTVVKPKEVAARKPPQSVEPQPPTPTVATATAPALPAAAADLVPSLPPAELAAMESHYLKNVRQQIAEKRFYPRRARRMGHQGTVLLKLVLLPDGSIGKVSLAESSGTQTLDEAALAAVRRVGRFPPFPQGMKREDWVLTVPIRYSVM